MASFDFDQVFGEDYLHFYDSILTEERSRDEADLIAGLLDLAPGMRVLDIPCGFGRIAARLAALGCAVVGVDASTTFLDVARRDGGAVDYRQADVRTFAADAEYDRIVNWFTSFGYFDDETDRGLLAAWHRALRPGGKLLIDHPNRQHLFRLLDASLGCAIALIDHGDDLLIDRTTFDAATSRTNTERISVRGGTVRRYRFSVRTFAFTELRTWLLDAGFRHVEGFGGDAEPFELDSTRMIAVATA